MRLLTYNGCGELHVTRDLADDEVPSYAILSHTWASDEEEVNFNEIESKTCTSKAGFQKVRFCGQQARKDSLEHFWVDTCCIDKSNHVELSEAITSMFRWYQNAQVCYVYLADVSFDRDNPTVESEIASSNQTWEQSFRRSRWFTRGWTLQELLAPRKVVFYSRECHCLGTKYSLRHLIHEITSIPLGALQNQPLSQFTDTERFRWVEGRRTKKKEDRAYCLLGIFNVYMYLNYGEGDNAYVRLMRAITNKPKVAISLRVAERATFDAYGQVYQGCHPATRVEILQSINEWAQDVKGRSIFWLNGMAGTGKSTISWTIARNLVDHGGSASVSLGASFFFRRGEGDRASASLLFPTIAQQLSKNIGGFDVFLAQAVQADPNIWNKSLGEQFKKLILEPVQKLEPSAGHASYVIVVDALDECESEADIRTVLQLWPCLPKMENLHLRLFLTSRPELVLRLGFKEMEANLHHDFILHEVPEPIIKHDLLAYLTDAMSEVRKRHNLTLDEDLTDERIADDWPDRHSLEQLTGIAAPLFIVAATMYRLISDDEYPQRCLEAILKFENRDHVAEVGPIYKLVLDRMTSSIKNEHDILKVQHEFRVIVGTIVTLAEPLSRTALAALLGLRPRDIHTRLSLLHAVLQVPSDGGSLIRPLHLSFSEYLSSQELRNTPFWIDSSATHAYLWKQCLRLLSSSVGLRENICDMEHPGQLRTEVPLERVQQCLPSGHRYACRYWIHHVEHSGDWVYDNGEVHAFLEAHFFHWLEALSLMDRISDAIDLLDSLKSRVFSTDIGVKALLEDAQRFVLTHSHVINLAPLQIYSSAVIFTPEESIVRRLCRKIPPWIQQHPRAISNWGSHLQNLEGHSGMVECVAFSPHEPLLASASEDKTVRIWDTKTGREVLVLEGHYESVQSIAFDPHSSVLASGSTDRTIRLWNIKTGREIQKLVGHAEELTSIAFSPHNSILASAAKDGTIRLWDTEQGKSVQVLNGHSLQVSSVAFNPHIPMLASGSWDKTIRLWNVETGQEIQKLEDASAPITSIAFSPHNNILASGSANGIIRLWDIRTGRQVQELAGHTDRISSVAFSPQDSVLASGSSDKTLRLWNVQRGQQVDTFRGHSGLIRSVAFHPQKPLLASGSYDRMVCLWSTKELSMQLIFNSSADIVQQITAITFSSDISLLISGSSRGAFRVWDVGTGRRIQMHQGQLEPVWSVSISSDNSLVAAGMNRGKILLWDVQSGQEIQTLQGPPNVSIASVILSPVGSILATVLYDNTVRIWDIQAGEQVQMITGSPPNPISIRFSPDGSRLALGSHDELLWLWNVQSGQLFWIFENMPTWHRLLFIDDTTVVTDKGTINTEESIAAGVSHVQPSEEPLIGVSGEWIMHNNQRLLWLPHAYRGFASFRKSKLGIGTESGRVMLFEFDFSKK